MTINPSEVTKLLKDQIKNFGEKAEVSEIGKVLSVGDGIARVYGLDNVQAGEMVLVFRFGANIGKQEARNQYVDVHEWPTVNTSTPMLQPIVDANSDMRPGLISAEELAQPVKTIQFSNRTVARVRKS